MASIITPIHLFKFAARIISAESLRLQDERLLAMCFAALKGKIGPSKMAAFYFIIIDNHRHKYHH